MQKKWDVFIVFRGKDVDRQGFLLDLCTALEEKHINSYTDEKLETGDEIPDLFLELDESHLVVVIFSQHFANSSFCLDELVRICRYRKPISEKIVVPVFYEVNAGDVQDLTGSFGKYFFELEKTEDQENQWRDALKEICWINGLRSLDYKTEFQLINAIVQVVWNKLCELPVVDSDNDHQLVGIKSQVKIVTSLLEIESTEIGVRMVGIWGLPGIGKTTLVDEVYNEIIPKFDDHYFARDVTGELKRQSLSSLRDKIIKSLLGLDVGSKIYIGTLNNISSTIKRRLRGRKVLIVFDNIENSEDLKALGGVRDLYKKGSRILVTTIDKSVLTKATTEELLMYKMEILGDHALEFFSWHAFNQNHPIEGFEQVTEEVISYAEGLPFALKDLGRQLSSMTTVDKWKDELAALKQNSNPEIVNVLKRSFHGLKMYEHAIFLDIACFLRGECKDRVERVVFPQTGMTRLIEKSIISISDDNRVDMLGWMQQIGQIHVEKECQEPGGRSRLWKYKNVFDVLTKDEGTVMIEGISLDSSGEENMHLSRTVFKKMENLRFLKVLSPVLFPNDLECLPKELRYLFWRDYPLEHLPHNFPLSNLVELNMHSDRLKTLWKEDNEPLIRLKYVDLSFSSNIMSIPRAATVPNLEVLKMIKCESLVWIPLFRNLLKWSHLKELDLSRNMSLVSLPENIKKKISNLRSLSVSECPNLKRLPELPNCLKCLDARSCYSLDRASSSFFSLEGEVGEGGCCNVDLSNCFSLDMNVISTFAENAFEMHLAKQAVALCISGDKLPQKMNLRHNGSSLSFLLEEHALIGVSLCGVISPIEDSFSTMLDFGCKATLKDQSGQDFTFIFKWNGLQRSIPFDPWHRIMSNWGGCRRPHMFIWYEPFNEENRFIEASFQFSYKFSEFLYEELPDRIYACGVHPIYDAMNEEHINTDNLS